MADTTVTPPIFPLNQPIPILDPADIASELEAVARECMAAVGVTILEECRA